MSMNRGLALNTKALSKNLAVETSCDDTSVAIVREDGFVIFNTVVNQHSVHQPYGGVVPELASRNHAHYLIPLIEQAFKESGYNWEDIDSLSVTNRPGLVGSLIVGLVTVKTLSTLFKKPYVAVNHIEGHILSPFLWDRETKASNLEFPFLALIVSGGHTCLFEVKDFGSYTIVGKTLDDAAGEVLDKVARLLGLGYPGGAEIDKLSQKAKQGQYTFSKVKLKQNSLDFSFSGLKTAAMYLIKELNIKKEDDSKVSSLCADFQEAVVDQIIDRLDRVIKKSPFKSVIVAGGVSANSRLRKRAKEWAFINKINLVLPPLKYCTDNAAMIGFAGIKRFQNGFKSPQNLSCHPHSLPEDFSLL